MQVSEIRSRVQAITGLVNHPRLTTGVIDALWWEGVVRMVREARPGYLRRTSVQDLVANQGEYPLPADGLVVLGVLALANGRWGRLTKRTQEELDDFASGWDGEGWSGPGVYYDSGVHSAPDANYGRRKITLLPTPRASVGGGLKVRDLRQPARLSEVPEGLEYIDLPAEYHEAPCNFAAWKFLTNASENPRQDVDKLFQVFRADMDAFVAHQKEDMEYDHEPVARLPVAANSLAYWSSL